MKKRINVTGLITDTLKTDLFVPSKAIDGRTAIPSIYTPSQGESKLVLVLGENAGGKSLFRRLIRVMTDKGGDGHKKGPHPVGEMVALSMQSRTASGSLSSMIYGSESYHSTGGNSAHTVTMGIKTVSEREHTTILYWDEPDVGMSGSTAAGAGVVIRDFIGRDPAPLLQAVFLTSHSPALVRQLVGCNPHYVFLGDAEGPRTVEEWVAQQNDPHPVTPEQLKEMSHKRFKDILAVLNSNRP